MGGRGFLVGNEVFCLFVVLRHAWEGKERKGYRIYRYSFIGSLVHSFVHSFRVYIV